MKNMQNNKIEKNEDEARVKSSRSSRVNNMIGDNEEVLQALLDAATKDNKYEEKIKSKKIEKKVEPCHTDNAQLGDLDQAIKTFADDDKKEKSANEGKIPSCMRIEDCDELNDFLVNKSQVDNCDSASCYEESNSSSHFGESEVPPNFEEWKK